MGWIWAEMISFGRKDPKRIAAELRKRLERNAVGFYLKSSIWRYPEITDKVVECARGEEEVARKLRRREVLAVGLERGRLKLPRCDLNPGYLLATDDFLASAPARLRLPWIDGLEEEFERISGERLRDLLPHLFLTTHETMRALGFYWEALLNLLRREGLRIAVPLKRGSLFNLLTLLSSAFLDEGGCPLPLRVALIKLISSSGEAIGIYRGRGSKLDRLLGRGEVEGFMLRREVAVVYPFRSIFGAPFEEERGRIIDALIKLAFKLMCVGYDFDLIPEPAAERLGRGSYRAVLIPPCETLSSKALKALKGLKGASIGVLSPIPYLLDGLGGRDAFELEEFLSSRRVKRIRGEEELRLFLSRAVRRRVRAYERRLNYPSGSTAIFYGEREGAGKIWLADLKGRGAELLVEIDGRVRLNQRFWHADGMTYAEAKLRPYGMVEIPFEERGG